MKNDEMSVSWTCNSVSFKNSMTEDLPDRMLIE